YRGGRKYSIKNCLNFKLLRLRKHRTTIQSHFKVPSLYFDEPMYFLGRFFSRHVANMNFTLALTYAMAVIWLFFTKCETAPELVTNVRRRFRSRPLLRGYNMENFLVEDDDIVDLNKRQFDDYGHMRFGKREQFEDYGHMRFGRNHE
ncbi:unnamed protein product, partial [Heterotrigona itama]